MGLRFLGFERDRLVGKSGTHKDPTCLPAVDLDEHLF
jgi:hypothetical protein